MTHTEIVNEVKSRLNLTSPESTARIGQFVNSRYRRVTSSLGLNTSRRAVVTTATVAGTDTVSFTMEKIEVLYDSTNHQVLQEFTYDELRNKHIESPASGTPREYAIMNQGSSTVTVLLYPTPDAILTLSADGLANASTLSGTNVPAFPADFHDILVFGAMADEYQKMEKPGQSQTMEVQYAARVSDLRYHLAKSSYLSITQGPSKPRRPRYTIVP
jgi:hypothetical protein